jgi:DNA repair exonuclease SbcCD ATPase subunit
MSEKVDQPDSTVQEPKEVAQDPTPDVKLGADFVPRARLNEVIDQRKQLEAQTTAMQAELNRLKAQGASPGATVDEDGAQWFDEHYQRAAGNELGSIKQELAEAKALLQQQAAVTQKSQYRKDVDAYIAQQESAGIEYSNDVKAVMRQLADNVVGTPAAGQITLEDLEDKAIGLTTRMRRQQRQEIANTQAGEPQIDPADLNVQPRVAPSVSQTQTDDPFAKAREAANTDGDWKRAFFSEHGDLDISPPKKE